MTERMRGKRCKSENMKKCLKENKVFEFGGFGNELGP